MTWGFVWLMLVLKIPVAALLWIVWWAVHQEPTPETGNEDGGTLAPPPGHPHRRPRGPHRFPRRRGPHGDPSAPRHVGGCRAMQPASVLSDGTIRRLVAEGRIGIDPWDPGLVQPASVDLRLGTSFRVFHNHRIQVIDLAAPPQGLTEHVEIADDDAFVIHPNEFVLGRTEERVELPADVVARIEGKSSLGRLGLIVHATAGFVDPGFQGTLTLEITNFNSVPIVLRPGLPIAQLSFMTLDQPAERPYGHPDLGSHYHGQQEATESRYRTPPPGGAQPSPTGRGVG